MNKRGVPIRLFLVFMFFICSVFVFLPVSAFAACPETMTSYWKLDGELNAPYLNEIDPNFDGVCRTESTCPTATTSGAVGDGAQQFANTTSTGINIPASATSTAPFDWGAADSFTIEFWIKRNAGAISNNEVVVGRAYTSSSINWWIGLQSNGAAAFRLRDSNGGNSLELNSTTPSLNDGQWHHIVAVRDGGLGINFLYVDGSLNVSNTTPFTYDADFKNPTTPLTIGYLNNSFYFNGLIDEVAIYNVALPASIIERHYILMKPYCEVSAPGVFRKGAWYLDANGTHKWDSGDITASFGISTDISISGDWNGDGFSSIGVFRNGAWYLDTNGSGKWDSGDTAISVGLFGISTDIPVTGDWNGDGFTSIGVFRKGAWYLDTNGSGKWDSGDTAIAAGLFGAPTDIPVTGDWNGDGITNIGTFRNGAWYLDYNGNGKWDSGVDIVLPVGSFGIANDKPITGVW